MRHSPVRLYGQSAGETGRLRGGRFWDEKPCFHGVCMEEDGASNGRDGFDLRCRRTVKRVNGKTGLFEGWGEGSSIKTLG